jgi:hypothetical protein
MGYCAAYGDNTLPTLRDNLSLPKHWYYHHKLRNILEERRSHLHRGGNLKSNLPLKRTRNLQVET